MRQFNPTSLKVKDFGWAKEIKFYDPSFVFLFIFIILVEEIVDPFKLRSGKKLYKNETYHSSH
jgi:hypothetical protein